MTFFFFFGTKKSGKNTESSNTYQSINFPKVLFIISLMVSVMAWVLQFDFEYLNSEIITPFCSEEASMDLLK
jgi:hypothetical protein